LINYLGNYDYYLEKKEELTSIYAPCDEETKSKTTSSKEDWKSQKEEHARLRKKQNELARIEEEIHQLETRDKEMNEMISILHPNQFNEILENLPEGTYYLQTISEMMSDVQQVKIEKGVAVFHNLNAGKEYILYENEAPSGYLKQDEEISIVLNPDFLTDEVEVVLTNSLIEIPNMKEQ